MSNSQPTIASTWWFGKPANEAAWPVLAEGGSALDAAEVGINHAELDPTVDSVGYGGLPNADGEVELDAAVYWAPTRGFGAVAGLKRIARAVSVARKVMETTPHNMLVGEGATRFALAHGFEAQDLSTPHALQKYEEWKVDPQNAIKSHDTIGLLAIDRNGDVCAATSTSGIAWKLPGRVGDSPLVGSGLFADNAVGAATATGVGEYLLRYCPAFYLVEAMRAGTHPQTACENFMKWVASDHPEFVQKTIAVLAMNKAGVIGAAASKAGFQYALTRDGETVLHDGPHLEQFR